jgi:predicted GNAT family acetyltransferase
MARAAPPSLRCAQHRDRADNDAYMTQMAHHVTDNSSRERFELNLNGAVAYLDYQRDGNVLTLIYAHVPTDLRASGIGSALVQGALAIMRARGEKVIARCSFVAVHIARHPDEQDLLAHLS